jgi:hypothetical protein
MGKDVFLKNIGDKVTLCFELNQDIDALNDNSKLSICSNSEGYDEKFQINKMDFGRGTLIIEYTDYENVTHDPLIYTNFLEANTALDADTKVQLFEEGDYKVSLDYEILKDGLGPADKYTHYCISFEFSVRNANCMVYPFDVVTGEELTNTAVTPNGFYLDLAKSRYLKMNITKEVLKDGANGLTEDTRFNTASKDGDTYTDEGIYTITVKNEYTGKETTKKIYVGDNAVLTAYMVTGMSISQINELMAQGAVINEDGTITIPEATDKVEEVEMESDIENDFVEESIEEVYETSETENETVISDSAKNNNTALIIIICLVLCVVIVILIFKSRKHSVSKDTSREGEQ